MKPRERPFVVGRRTARQTTLVVLGRPPLPRIPGPWTLRAVVTPARPA